MTATVRFDDMNVPRSKAGSERRGCFTPAWGWVVTVFVAAAVAVGVGLGVYYLHPDRNRLPTGPSTATLISTTPDSEGTKSSAPTSPPPDIRLPSALQAEHYNVRLRPDIYTRNPDNFTFNGTVEMYLYVLEDTDEVVFHFNWLLLLECQVYRLDGTRLPFSNVSSNEDKMFAILHMAEVLKQGKHIIVKVDFMGYIFDNLIGLYYAPYARDEKTVHVLTSMLHPIHARRVFPCLDEPARKATFNMTLERKSHFSSMFNTVIVNSENLHDEWVADHYATTPKMSTYLLAFLVSDFDCTNTSSKFNTYIEVCSRPNAINQTDFALGLAGSLQTWYEEYFLIKYPLPKMVHVAAPNFAAGAMENWGLVFYRETNLLYDSSTSSAEAKQRIPTVLAHELAHQWFGNLVTPGWWDDTWLNEGFASWMEVPCADSLLPDWKLEDQFVAGEMHRVMRTDGLASSHPVYQSINSPEEIDAIFDSITYSKGAAVVRMMYYFLGDSVFREGMTNYLNEKAYSDAHHDDLFIALTEESAKHGQNLNVTEIMYPWIRQMGYPVVHHSYDNLTGRVSISQQHFLLDPTQVPQDSIYRYKWDVPIRIATNLNNNWNKTFDSWLKEKQGELSGLPTGATWIIGNPGEQFFYRVNYDIEMWDSLINQLNIDHQAIRLPVSRAQLIDDAFNLGRANTIDQMVGMRCTQYLNNEMEYVPWVSATANLEYVEKMFKLSSNYGYLQRYMTQISGAQHDALGWKEDPVNDPHIEQRRRSLLLNTACSFGYQRCLDNATESFATWRNAAEEGSENPISLNLREATYCYGVANGGIDEWSFVLERYSQSNSAGERAAFLRALACATEPYILNGYLQLAFEGNVVATQDFINVIIYVSQNPAGLNSAWNFFRTNWEQINKIFGDVLFAMPRMVSGITDSFSTDWKLNELEAFILSNPDLGNAAWAFAQAVESTKININWRTRNEANIAKWLENVLK